MLKTKWRILRMKKMFCLMWMNLKVSMDLTMWMNLKSYHVKAKALKTLHSQLDPQPYRKMPRRPKEGKKDAGENEQRHLVKKKKKDECKSVAIVSNKVTIRGVVKILMLTDQTKEAL
ncbi:hypothetical protein vseg_007935 [Gypsophila vaccaria]